MLQRKGNDTHTRHSREEEMVVSFRSSDSQLYGYYSVVLAIKRTKRRHLPDDDPAAGNVSSRSSARELNVYWPRSCSTLFAGDWPTALLLYYYWYIYFYYRRRSSHSIVIMWCDVMCELSFSLGFQEQQQHARTFTTIIHCWIYSNTVCDEPIHFSAIRWLCKKKRVPKNLHKLIIISGFHWVTHTKFSHVKWSLNTDLISLMRYICLWSIL